MYTMNNPEIKAFIAEDEPLSAERLKDLLDKFPDISVIGEAGDGISAVKQINRLKPGLLFLDIHMPGASGFEVLEQIDYRPRPLVIFITAFDQYALKAFEENAVDYILKPLSLERLEKSVNRVIQRNAVIDERMLERLRLAMGMQDYMKRFTVSRGDEIIIIPEHRVYYFKAEDKYTFLYTDKDRFFFDLTLKELEQCLDPHCFCRIHKSTIVALEKIVKIKKWFKRDVLLQLDDPQRTSLKVSRIYKPGLMKRLKYRR
jgi:DNA-binding LytR/AlgR family response regulator